MHHGYWLFSVEVHVGINKKRHTTATNSNHIDGDSQNKQTGELIIESLNTDMRILIKKDAD